MRLARSICKRCHEVYSANFHWSAFDDRQWDEKRIVSCPVVSDWVSVDEFDGDCLYIAEHVVSQNEAEEANLC